MGVAELSHGMESRPEITKLSLNCSDCYCCRHLYSGKTAEAEMGVDFFLSDSRFAALDCINYLQVHYLVLLD